jgi:hypothetical protein
VVTEDDYILKVFRIAPLPEMEAKQ